MKPIFKKKKGITAAEKKACHNDMGKLCANLWIATQERKIQWKLEENPDDQTVRRDTTQFQNRRIVIITRYALPKGPNLPRLFPEKVRHLEGFGICVEDTKGKEVVTLTTDPKVIPGVQFDSPSFPQVVGLIQGYIDDRLRHDEYEDPNFWLSHALDWIDYRFSGSYVPAH